MPRRRPSAAAGPEWPAPSADDLLAAYPPPVRALAASLRAFVRDAVPGIEERVYQGWRALGYHDAQAGYVCAIFPQQDHVRFLFEHGAHLPDPDGILEGATRQTRWVPIAPGAPVPERALRRLLESALRYGSV